ncbi:MAG: alpha/beta hydrolase [Chitinophagaceae bacterium]|nr:alpha/beta hydrolase [Chitinophagaceae bacterium]
MSQCEQKQYQLFGKGEPVVLLYGLMGSARNFQYLIDFLQKDYQVIVPIFPFYTSGISVSIHTLTDFVHTVIAELGLSKVHLVGNSMGGHIALLYTLSHPELVASLVLSGSSGLYENSIGDTFPRRKDYAYIREKTAATFYDPAVADKHLVDEIYALVNSRKVLQILALAKSTIRNNLQHELSRIQVPVCLIWGKQDLVTPPQVAEQFLSGLPNAALHWIDQCGHVPMLERPDIFNEILGRFLQERAIHNLEPKQQRFLANL